MALGGDVPTAPLCFAFTFQTLNSCFKKIFSTNSQEVISECRDMFHCLPAEDVIVKRKKKFLLRFVNSDNLLCNVFNNIANEDLAALAN